MASITEHDTTITENVRLQMARKNTTRKQVLESLGFSADSLHRRVHGHTPWGGGELRALAELMGIPVALFYAAPGDEAPVPDSTR